MTNDLSYKVEIYRTLDGSDTVFVSALKEHYHSTFGAIRESRHVFIEHGLLAVEPDVDPVLVFEMGFGTGLNALLTCLSTMARGHGLNYTAIELNPLEKEVWQQLNYPSLLPEKEAVEVFRRLHEAPWDIPSKIESGFVLTKLRADIRQYIPCGQDFHVVYYDAFGPDVQPELWSKEIFGRMYGLLKPGGILVTYSCKGDVRRALKAAGFSVEKLPGPPGKREILRGRS
ncbi:MAG: tRNA (5-methylaminomethyl-2-thiouridine)(34)-methyltransferase MnmD [bacterium]